MENNYVVSYVNPDTDGVACSIAMALLLSRKTNNTYVPGTFGNINPETKVVLEYCGLSSIKNMGSSLRNPSKIVLVDTHHIEQLPKGFPSEKVCLIIDHHDKGDDSVFPNALIDNRKIGAAASIVAEKCINEKVIDEKLGKLLACAIVSNTLNFTATSTSDFDRKIFDRLSQQYPIDNIIIKKMFEQRGNVFKRGFKYAMESDMKKYNLHNGILGISQIEAYDLLKIVEINSIVEALKAVIEEQQLDYCLFNGVDVHLKQSIVICGNLSSKKIASLIFKKDFSESYEQFDRVLQRKTDFVPFLDIVRK